MPAIEMYRWRQVWCKRSLLAAAVAISVSAFPVDAQFSRETLRFGGAVGWPEMEMGAAATLSAGWQGGMDIVLADRQTPVTDTTDLLIDGESRTVVDAAGTYDAATDGTVRVESASARGSGAVFLDGPGSISLREIQPEGESGRTTGLFSGRQSAQSFTVEFWAYPLSLEEGSAVIEWRGTYVLPDRPVHQELRVDLHRGRFRWLIRGFWPIDGSMVNSVELLGRSPVVPRQWHHHQLYYDGDTGKLEYRVDGVPEDIQYATVNGDPGRSSGPAILGAASRNGVVIGRGFRGGLDDLTVYTSAPYKGTRAEPHGVKYEQHAAEVITHPIDLGTKGKILDSINVRSVTPPGTAVEVYARIAELLVSDRPQDAIDSEWIPVPDLQDQMLSSTLTGRYLQLRFRLLSDPFRERTPRIQEAVVAYRDVSVPPPPPDLVAESTETGVRLSWPKVLLPHVAGYRVHVYQANGPAGIRYGSIYDVGDSTQFTIETLDTGRAYLFAVETYDRFGQTSVMSVERQARPGGGMHETSR